MNLDHFNDRVSDKADRMLVVDTMLTFFLRLSPLWHSARNNSRTFAFYFIHK